MLSEIRIIYSVALTIALVFLSLNSFAVEREQIGEVLGSPVFRDELSTVDSGNLSLELQSLFIDPVLDQFCRKHNDELLPDRAELDLFIAYQRKQHEAEIQHRKKSIEARIEKIRMRLGRKKFLPNEREKLIGELYYLTAELEPPGEEYAAFILTHWKRQIYFYRNYGGGRVLWQQRGLTAFDAYYKWVKEQAEKGAFAIYDEKLKTTFYSFWTSVDHGEYLLEDIERIEKEFLSPEWISH